MSKHYDQNIENIEIERVCPFCGKLHLIYVSEQSLKEFKHGGKSIQHAFSDLNKNEIEILVTGICELCWDLNLCNDAYYGY